MANFRDYITLSERALLINEIYANSKDFADNYKVIHESEKKAYLRHYLFNNKPYAFDDKPLLFEQINQYLSDIIGIPNSDIRLIGSAKTGFTISSKEYGKKYTQNGRDLDFSIINEDLFYVLKDEFENWTFEFDEGIVIPKNTTEEIYWRDNKLNVAKQINRGFIDTYKIPNYTQYKMAQKINNSMYIIVRDLKAIYSIEQKEASVRVFKNWTVFLNQVKLNTESVLNKINE